MFRRHPLAVAAAVLVLAGSAPQARQPQFKAGVELVTVDVVATGRDGAPVRGLTAADFEVFEDGVSRPIETFQLIDALSIPARQPLWPGLVDNQREPGALFAVVIDELGLQMPDVRDVRRVAGGFLERSLADDDYVAVLRGNADSGFFLTSDRALAVEAVAGSRGFTDRGLGLEQPEERPDGGPPESLDTPDNAVKKASFDTLIEVVQKFRPIRARRKAILWISRGGDLKLDEFDEPAEVERSGDRTGDRLSRLIDAARAANVAIYTLDPRGLVAPSTAGAGAPAPERLDSLGVLRQLADATGGRALINTNDLAGALDRVAAENRAYYLLGYAPREGSSRRPRRLKVTTRAAGVALLHRTTYAPGGAPETSAPDLLSTPLPVAELPITLAPAVVAGARGRRGIMVPFEIGSGLAAGAEVEYVAVAFDSAGRPGARATGRASATGGRAFGAVTLPVNDGIHQIRLAGSIKGTETRGLAMATVRVLKGKSEPATCGGFAFQPDGGERAFRDFDRQRGLSVTTVISAKSKDGSGFAFGLGAPGQPHERSWPAKGHRLEDGLWQFTLALKAPLPNGQVDVTLLWNDEVAGPGCRTTATMK